MNTSSLSVKEVFAEIDTKGAVSAATARRAFDAILAGEWTPVQIAGFLVALRQLPEDASVLGAAAESMRSAMVPVDHGLARVLDTCGTGGDGKGTLNLSTGAAILASACGIPVAKHGNRAVSSQSGSADVLEALGVNLQVPPTGSASMLKEIGIAFLLAPQHHPAMRHAVPVRRELGVRTLFNVLGPLANPARATHQLVGTYSDSMRPLVAKALGSLGVTRAWVVHSHDGLDEVSPHGPTRVTELDHGITKEFEIRPEDFGLAPLPSGVLKGQTAAHNAAILRQVLSGEPHPSRDAFVLNGAAALVVADHAEPQRAAQRIWEVIASGAALRHLDAWCRASMAWRSPQGA